VLLALWAESI